MIIDAQNKFCAAQAVTTSALSEDQIDMGSAGDIGLSENLQLMINVDETVTAAGAATVTMKLQCDSDPAFGSAKTVIQTAAIPKATLVAGHQIFLPVPMGLDERYLGVYFEVATGPLTAGKFTAALVHGVQKNIAYPDAL
ncbi:Bbp16 family capsid cement protein [Bdellovibrio bacteriovorus]